MKYSRFFAIDIVNTVPMHKLKKDFAQNFGYIDTIIIYNTLFTVYNIMQYHIGNGVGNYDDN